MSNSMDREYVRVVGGYNLSEEQGEGAKKTKTSIFVSKREVVVESRHLAALFRRDHELCGMIVRISRARERDVDSMVFSERVER